MNIFAEYRKGVGISQETLADWFEVSPEVVKDWESGKVEIPGPAMVLIKLIRRRRDAYEYFMEG